MKKNTNKNNGTANPEIVRTPKDIDIKDLNHAPWNPRPKIEKKDVAELAASIEAGGLIHRIGVWKNEKGKFVVIDGNRRLEALKSIGKKTAPCDILEIDETKAREMTITANLQRTDSDPFMMAENIQQLRDKGRTIEEIAAALGKGVNWVWKRLQLTNIADCWKKEHMSGKHTFTLDALEKISRYSKELQEEVFKDSTYNLNDEGETAWYRIKNMFEYAQKDLKNAPFNKSECKNCTNNTETQPVLFDIGDGKNGGCGKCMNEKCFMKKYAEHMKAEKEKIEEKTGEKIQTIEYAWNIPGNRTEKKTKKNTVPYLVKEDGIEKVYWGEKSKLQQKPAKSDKERAAEKEEKRKKKILKGACGKIKEWSEKFLKQTLVGIMGGGEEMDFLAKNIASNCIICMGGYAAGQECAVIWKALMREQEGDYKLTDEETELINAEWKEFFEVEKEFEDGNESEGEED